VHNRVESIYSIGNLVTRLVPEARVVVAHGQMSEDALERAMLDFVRASTTCSSRRPSSRTGSTSPNANTMIINRADRFGLAQLYQLRGRVGRSDRAAYAYLLVPPQDSLSPVARKRLAAIREFSDLGSGFRVAALDLEIRGAGNLLGGEQSGQIEAVGFEMYMKLLEQTVRELKGEEIEDDVRAAVNLQVDLRIEDAYIPDMNQRMMVYRSIAAARREDELTRVLEEVRDRYGPLPATVLNLADYGRIRMMADRLGVEAIDREGQLVVFRFRQQARVDPGAPGHRHQPPRRRGHAAARRAAARPAAALRAPGERRTGAWRRGDAAACRPAAGPGIGRVAGLGRKPVTSTELLAAAGRGERSRQPLRRRGGRPGRQAGGVAGGFTKAEILKPAAEDPRGPNGVFNKVGGLLSELTGPQ
jgi:hypothetical protein